MIDPGTQVLRCFLGRVEHEKKRRQYRLVGKIAIIMLLSMGSLALYQAAHGSTPVVPLSVGAFLVGSWMIHRVRIMCIRRSVFRSG